MIGRGSAKVTGIFPAVDDTPWLRKLWIVVIAVSICGAWFFEISIRSIIIHTPMLAMLVFLYLFLISFFAYQGRINANIKVGKYLLFLILWLVWALASILWIAGWGETFKWIESLICGFVMIILSLLFLGNEKTIKNIPYLWIALNLLVIVIGIWESRTGMHLSASRYIGTRETYPTATFYNPNDFATFLCLSVPFLFFLIRQSKRHLPKVLGLALIVASFYFIILNASRANIIAFLLIIGLIFLLAGWRAKLKFISLGLLTTGLIVPLSLTLILGNNPTYLEMLQRITSITDLSDPENIVRVDLVRNGLIFLQNSHFLGVGVGNFEYLMVNNPVYYTWGIINAHNWWLEILVDYGVLIFSLFLVFYIGLLGNLFHIFRNSRNQTLREASLATFISLAAFSISCLSSSGLSNKMFIWFLFASALCTINCYRIEQRNKLAMTGNDR